MKSGARPYHTQLLTVNSKSITWDHWVSAFRWDLKQHSLPVHRKLTEKHLFPTNQEKMRNALAEDCLDKEMLHLMQVKDINMFKNPLISLKSENYIRDLPSKMELSYNELKKKDD